MVSTENKLYSYTVPQFIQWFMIMFLFFKGL